MAQPNPRFLSYCLAKLMKGNLAECLYIIQCIHSHFSGHKSGDHFT